MKYFYSIVLFTVVAAILVSVFFFWRSTTPELIDQQQNKNFINQNSTLEPQEELITEEDQNQDAAQESAEEQVQEQPQEPTTEEETITDNSDFGSCNDEIPKFCPGVKGKINLVNCLLDEHGEEISDACRASLERRQQLNEELVAACKVDTSKFCAGVKPKVGEEPLVDCLEEHKDELSAACLEAFLAHEAAKPDQ